MAKNRKRVEEKTSKQNTQIITKEGYRAAVVSIVKTRKKVEEKTSKQGTQEHIVKEKLERIVEIIPVKKEAFIATIKFK